jgi:single-stranded-DNA-specific exonuclease
MLYAAYMKKIWRLRTSDPTAVQRLQTALSCHPVTASILAERGMNSPADARRFLYPSLKHLRPPFEIKDLNKAVSRIYRAMIQNENLLIFGDYDADGVTATTLLYQFLNRVGVNVSFYLPHRVTDGYGLKPRHISEIAVPNNIGIIVTVDCGSSSHDAVALAQHSGIDVIITDHHEPPAMLPPAFAVVNPKRRDCSAGFEDLAGVGVAFFLIVALRRYLRQQAFWKNAKEPDLRKGCDLVALGTVADMVPLTRENRILVKTGLNILRTTRRCGIDTLIQAIGIDKQRICTEDLAYKIAPRINAAGRIKHAEIAANLLITTQKEHAAAAAATLNDLNTFRQAEEKRILEDILAGLKKDPTPASSKCMVLSGEGWHEGILGILATRLSGIYFKPVVLIAVDGDLGKGSGRSVPGFNLLEAITACGDLLLQFGGHAMAAGVQIKRADIESFKARLAQVAVDMSGPKDFVPEIFIDYELNLDQITPGLADELELLQPFGTQNPEPLFMTHNVHVVSSSLVGGVHRRMVLSPSPDGSICKLPAIHFNADSASIEKEFFSQLAYKIQWNRWNGNKKLQLLVEDTVISI